MYFLIIFWYYWPVGWANQDLDNLSPIIHKYVAETHISEGLFFKGVEPQMSSNAGMTPINRTLQICLIFFFPHLLTSIVRIRWIDMMCMCGHNHSRVPCVFNFVCLSGHICGPRACLVSRGNWGYWDLLVLWDNIIPHWQILVAHVFVIQESPQTSN